MRRLLGVLVGAGLMAATGSAAALDFTVDADRPETAFIFASGHIVEGDGNRFRQLVRRQTGKEVVLVITSPGGSLMEGGEIADWVARWRISVMVPMRRVCASACFLILAASPERVAFRSSSIGVHSASVSTVVGEDRDTLAVTTLMARVAGRYGVPQSIIGRMVTTGPDDMAWLSETELRAMRVALLDELPSPPATSTSPAGSIGASAQPLTGSAQPSTTLPPRTAPPGDLPPFQQGLADRTAWERWFAGLPPSGTRNGAEWWAAQRNSPKPGSCESSDSAFAYGCMEASRRLARSDARRRTDPDYRRGWNSY